VIISWLNDEMAEHIYHESYSYANLSDF